MTGAVIYRIEHRVDRLGPYPGKENIREEMEESFWFSHEDSDHPAPYEDSLEVYNFWKDAFHGEYFCGMPSRTGIYEWFVGYFQKLKTNNFVLAIYWAPEGTYAIGYQALFKKKDAILLSQEELDPFILKEKENN